jgi:molybdopterin converting factor small subunit
MAFQIQVLLFASAREAAGNVSSVELELNEGADTAVLR